MLIATPDGLRQIELGAGQSAYAGGAAADALAFRRTAGAPLEPVEAIRLREVVGADVTLSVAGEDWRVTVSAAAGEPRRQSCADDRLKTATLHRVEGMVRVA